MNDIKESIINRMDLNIFKYCQNRYGINRSIYNTIEQWFYNKKVQEIVSRRQYVLCFLDYVCGDKIGYIKFGNRRLMSKLHKFWENKNL